MFSFFTFDTAKTVVLATFGFGVFRYQITIGFGNNSFNSFLIEIFVPKIVACELRSYETLQMDHPRQHFVG